MSTTANIAIQIKENEYRYVYLHSDGYPSYALAKLNEHYKERSKVLGLIALGDLSVLDESIDCPRGHAFNNRIPGYTVSYIRDRNESEASCCAQQASHISDMKDQNYLYVYTLNDEWRSYNC